MSSASLRIAVFCAYYPPHVGGYERNVHELCWRLAAKGHDVLVVTSTAGKAASCCKELDGVKVVGIPAWDILGGTYPVPKPTLRLLRALKAVARFKPHVVNTQTRFFPTSLLGAIVACRLGARHVHTERGTSHPVVANPLVSWLSRVYDHTLGHLVVSRASLCIGVSTAATQFARHLGAQEVAVVPNGIEVRPPSDDEVRRLRNLLAPNGEVLFCYVGRLVHGKGVHDLIRAFATTRENVPNSRLVLVGDGPSRGHLESLTASLSLGNAVCFWGMADREAAMSVLTASDVFVNPSYTEGLPTTVLEAAALGRAIVATDVGGTCEIVCHDVSGLLCEPGDIATLSDTLWTLAKGPSLRTRLGVEAQSHTVNFDWDNLCSRWESVVGCCDG